MYLPHNIDSTDKCIEWRWRGQWSRQCMSLHPGRLAILILWFVITFAQRYYLTQKPLEIWTHMGITTADPHVCLVIIKDCLGIIKYCLFHDRLMLIVVEPLDLLFLDSLLKHSLPSPTYPSPGNVVIFAKLSLNSSQLNFNSNSGWV